MNKKLSFIKGVGYIAIAKYSGIVISLFITAILARLLTPEDYGVVGIATLFIIFFSLMGDIGLGPAIIQFKELTDRDLASLFGLSFWIACFLSILFIGMSPIISLIYNDNRLQLICMLLSIQIFFTTINAVPNGLLLRDKRFDILAVRNVTIQVLCGIISCLCAYIGFGLYALIISPILSSILTFIVNKYYSNISIFFIPSKSSIKKIRSYSMYQFFFSIVNYFGRNLDKLLIGKILSMNDLGYYEKSYRLMQMPIENINGVISPVLQPYLADYQNDPEHMLGIYNRMEKILFNISFPLAGVTLLLSREIILILFGPQWIKAINCFAIMTLTIATQIPTVNTGAILQSSKRTDLLFKLGNVNVVLSIVGLLIATFVWGTIEAISLSFSIIAIIVAVNNLYTIYHILFKTSFKQIVHIIFKPFLCYLILVLAYLFFKYFTSELDLFTSVMIKCIFSIAIFFIYFQFFTEYKPILLLNFIKKK